MKKIAIVFVSFLACLGCKQESGPLKPVIETLKNEKFVLISVIRSDTGMKDVFGDTLRTDLHQWYVHVRPTDQLLPVNRINGSSFEEKLAALRLVNLQADTIEYKKASIVIYGIPGIRYAETNIF